MLARLIDDCSGQQFCRIEFAHREALKPCFLTAREAAKLCAPDVPQLDIDTVRAALAEQKNGHESEV